MEREDRLELRGDVTYDRKRERAREEERKGMYSTSRQSLYKTNFTDQDFQGSLQRSGDNTYTSPQEEFQQQESLHSESNGEIFLIG